MSEIEYGEVVNRIQGIYASCNTQEQKQLIKILTEISEHGYSYTLEQIYLTDFKAVPVSIDRFLSDPYYMGETNGNGTGVYPFWRETLNDIFTHGNRYNEIILSGATRIGKSTTAVSIMCYMLYRLMLYRNPQKYFGLKPVSRITLAFANLTKELAYGVAYKEFQNTVKKIPFFQEHGSFTRSDRNYYYIPEGDYIDIVAGSDAANFLGMQLWATTCDEVNFSKSGTKDINLAKRHMKELYDTINARVSGTFRLNGEIYGKMVTASSKNTDNDYLSDHIETQLAANNKHLYLVDRPQWEILPKSKFSDKVFHFTVGDRYKRGFVIPEEDDDEAHRAEYRSQGYQVVEAPAELRKNFVADYDIALRDIAGISVSGAMGFITQEMISPCISQDRVNPFYENILTIGTRDDKQIYEFFHEEVVPNDLKVQEMHIHIDLAETRNRTGIVGCCVCGNKIVENEEGKKVSLPMMKQVFGVAIQAPRGDRQSFQKVINFISWLRQHHFNISMISTDQYQSSFLRETLEQQNFETSKFSVTKSMEPFIGIKNLLIDQRIELVKNQQQEDELISIQRVGDSIFIPEDAEGGHGDIAECLAGSTYSLVLGQTTSRPPSKSVASIAAAVNGVSRPRSFGQATYKQYAPGIMNPLGALNNQLRR